MYTLYSVDDKKILLQKRNTTVQILWKDVKNADFLETHSRFCLDTDDNNYEIHLLNVNFKDYYKLFSISYFNKIYNGGNFTEISKKDLISKISLVRLLFKHLYFFVLPIIATSVFVNSGSTFHPFIILFYLPILGIIINALSYFFTYKVIDFDKDGISISKESSVNINNIDIRNFKMNKLLNLLIIEHENDIYKIHLNNLKYGIILRAVLFDNLMDTRGKYGYTSKL